ncbi:hypothetical protein [Cohnella candidum]|uniref:hypothetical protein n=1 Tax=Cohnella candidum TaxID=2674991 RepID=UPI0013DDC9F6|nr:hypothetical protein [Cohnella candidum]
MKMLRIILSLVLLFVAITPNAFAAIWTNQDVTAYTGSMKTSSGSTRLTHSGLAPQVGFAAVRKNTSGTPVVPFGTTIKTPQNVSIEGQSLNTFTVQDTGVDPNLSSLATDLWFGFCRTNAYTGSDATPLGCNPGFDSTYINARAFGQKKWDLVVTTP